MKLISQPSKGKEKGSHCTSTVVSVMVLNFSPCGVAKSRRDQEVVKAGLTSLQLFCYWGDGNGALLVSVSSIIVLLGWRERRGIPSTVASHCFVPSRIVPTG